MERTAFPAVLWIVWKARNSQCFEDSFSSVKGKTRFIIKPKIGNKEIKIGPQQYNGWLGKKDGWGQIILLPPYLYSIILLKKFNGDWYIYKSSHPDQLIATLSILKNIMAIA